ncbi:MAG TPA: hypothetical protein VFE58_15150 [Tepidisphaeraceae bacterium]|nr:hypothetical protein [Tepidisphaeraceae bacterium]
MTTEATTLLAAALKSATLTGSFSPTALGARCGLNELQALAAARYLANAGVLIIGFDSAAHFSPDYRKAHTPSTKKLTPKSKKSPRRNTPAKA